ncbi:MAG: FAD-dependent oxidoreductase [Patescibacteria group bacterium]
MKNVIILGSGIQGICAAFALNKKGYSVTVVEKESSVINKTSKNQEGRVHLGFTYALDKSGMTGNIVLNNSLHFSLLLEEWLGKIQWAKYLMPKGYYLVHKDSLLTESELIDYYEKLDKTYLNFLKRDSKLSYFGKRPETLFKVLKDIPNSMSRCKISAVIKTEERIVEMFYLRDLILDSLKKTTIKIMTDTEVQQVIREDKGFTIIAKSKNNEEVRLKSDIVANCLWNNRILIDKTLGITTLKDPLYRFKCGILGTVDRPVPTCSIVTGVFGNISPRLDHRHAYISWHSECMQGITTDGTTPAKWEDSFNENLTTDLNSSWIKNTISNLSEFVPSLKTFKPIKLLPGIICSAGKTDIGDKDSKVHSRGSHIGVHSFDGYFSVDTGKFCSAPFFANELVKKVEEL